MARSGEAGCRRSETAEERQLLRVTRPIRDPLDVLQARIAGTRLTAPQPETEPGKP